MLGRYGNANSVECIEGMALLARLHDARLQRLVESKQPRFECLPIGDVVDGASNFSAGEVISLCGLPPGHNPPQTVVRGDTEFNVKLAVVNGGFHCGINFGRIIEEDNPSPISQGLASFLQSEDALSLRAPIPAAGA